MSIIMRGNDRCPWCGKKLGPDELHGDCTENRDRTLRDIIRSGWCYFGCAPVGCGFFILSGVFLIFVFAVMVI